MDSDKIIIRERKNNLIGDDVSMNLIIEDDINNIKSDFYIMTHATNPLLTSSSIDKGIKELKNRKIKILSSAQKKFRLGSMIRI